MAKPTYGPLWATSGDRVPPTSGKRASGFKPSERPAAQLVNDILGNLGDWIAWLEDGSDDITTLYDISQSRVGNWLPTNGAGGANPGNSLAADDSLGPPDWVQVIEPLIDSGRRIKSVKFRTYGDGAADMSLAIGAVDIAGATNEQRGIISLTNVAAAFTEREINLVATASALTVTVAAGAGTFTRSAGDFLADGFSVGNLVTWTGFTNAGNNVVGRRITALSATVMTFSDTSGLVNETGNGNEAVSGDGLLVTSTVRPSLNLSADGTSVTAAGLFVSHLRLVTTRD